MAIPADDGDSPHPPDEAFAVFANEAPMGSHPDVRKFGCRVIVLVSP